MSTNGSVFRKLDISKKTVLVTGASAGIGKAIAEGFAECKCKVIIAARRKERLDEFKKYLEDKYGVEVYALPLDMQDIPAIKKLPDSLPPEFRNVDILVNNAGVSKVGDIDKYDLDDMELVLDTNIKSVFVLTRLIVPGMKERGYGHVINISSILAEIVFAGWSAYNASKFAIKGMSETIRQDLLKTPVRVTEIRPGYVQTEILAGAFGQENADQFETTINELLPIDVADAVVYAATRPENLSVNVMTVEVSTQK